MKQRISLDVINPAKDEIWYISPFLKSINDPRTMDFEKVWEPVYDRLVVKMVETKKLFNEDI